MERHASTWKTKGPNIPSIRCPLTKQLYAPVVIRRTIDEFVKAKDTRLIGILKDLLQYPDVYVQVRDIPLWTLESPTLFPFSPIFVANPNGLRFTQPLIVPSNC
ncbi:MAG: hypothetical protein ACE1ZW_05585 [Nitrospirales bacterium]